MRQQPLQTSMKGILHDLQLSKGTLSTLSFDLFRDWTINASKMHTELDFTIKDERVLVRDLQKSIVNGLIALEEKPSDELSFKGRGYKNGFLRGFVFSNLECKWSNDYIDWRSTKMKEIALLRAVVRGLEGEEAVRLKILAEYKDFFKSGRNFLNMDHAVKKEHLVADRVDLHDLQTVDLGETSSELEILDAILHNLMDSKIVKYSKVKHPDYFTNFYEIFTTDHGQKILDYWEKRE